MTQFEKQLTSLELSQKMKEFGFEQKSLWHWRYSHTGCHPSNPSMSVHQNEFMENPEDACGWYYYSAYTVAELLNLIYSMTGLFPCIHDRNLNPEQLTGYLAQVACDLKETENE